MIELFNVDCMAYMATQPDKAFDLAIVDPPYGENDAINLKNGENKQIKNRREYQQFQNIKPESIYFDELKRVSKNQIIWGGNYFGLAGGYIFWQKVFEENKGVPFGEGELAYCSMQKKITRFRFVWQGCWQGDMSKFQTRIHPTQKPIQLYQWLLTNYAKPGQRILDTHLGSGSSAIAAHYFGVDFVGCEIDEHYFRLTKERFDNETRQVAMFQ